MEKEFVPYELAVKLKVLGFDWPCYAYIYTGDTGNNYDHYLEVKPSDAKDWNGKSDLCISRPLFQQAFRWFREKYKLSPITSQFGYSIEDQFGQIIHTIPDDENPLCYEEAELACLEKLIKIVEQK
jgi:hypothetical protein